MQIKYRKNDYFDIVCVQINDNADMKEEIELAIIYFINEKNTITEFDHIDILNITYLKNDYDYLVAIVEFAIIRG
ncbi:MAG: hypothetical protein WC136_03720 [Sphaerochaeta sp.]